MYWNQFYDPKLARCLDRLAKQHPNWTENDYFRHFLHIINDDYQANSLKKTAYLWFIVHLYPVIKQVIKKLSLKLYNYEEGEDSYSEVITDLLTDRNGLKTILNRYNPQHISQSSFRGYFASVVERRIKERLKLQSSWHLLGHSSRKDIKQALARSGLSPRAISRYVLAWECFIRVYKENHIYNPYRNSNDSSPSPEQADFTAATKDYNSRRFQPDVPPSLSYDLDLTTKELEVLLNQTIAALYDYQNILEVSRDANDYEKYARGNEFSGSPWQRLENQEEHSSFAQQVEQAFREELSNVEKKEENFRSRIPKQFRKGLMLLCYNHSFYLLRQSQFAAKVGVHQGTVSRYIDAHYRQTLLRKLEFLINRQLAITEETWVENCVNDFLDSGISNESDNSFVKEVLSDVLQEFDAELKIIVKLKFIQKISIEQIVEQLNKTKEYIEEKIHDLKKELANSLFTEMQKSKQGMVHFWLSSHYRRVIDLVLLNFLQTVDQESREIIKLYYCQQQQQEQIQSNYSHLNISSTIAHARQYLQTQLHQWIKSQFSIDFDSKEEKHLARVIEEWLSNLVYSSNLID